MPTVASAEETPPTDPATTTQTTEATPTEEPSGEPAPDASTPPAEDPAATDPPAETPDASEPPAEETPDEVVTEEQPQEAARLAAPEDEVATLVVPNPGAGQAVITVRTGDTRSLADPNSISPLAGVQLGLFTAATGGTQLFTCTADADGDCNFVVPDTGPGGANRDREMYVRQIAAPGGYFTNPQLRTGDAFGGDNQQTPYSFRVGALVGGTWQVREGQTYRTTPPATFMVGTGNTNRIASGGVWQTSRTNPVLPQQCGLDIALVMDLSGSVNPFVDQARTAAKTLVDAMVGTPSRMGLFTFAAAAPANATNNQNRPITAVSTAAGASTVKTWIDGLTAPTNGTTNWDRGLYQVAQVATVYDVVIILTDGNPTVYGTETAPGNFTRTREVENAIFSANAVKNKATRIVALGVGSGVSAPSTALNLRAISGGTAFNGSNSATADYYQTADYAAAGQAMRDLALGNCQGSVSVVKQVVPPSGDLGLAQPAGGWAIGASGPSAGITVGTPNPADGLTAAGTGSISFPLDFAGGTTGGTVTIRETNQAGFTHLPQAGVNAVCRDLNTNTVIPGVVNAPDVAGQPGVIVPVSTSTAASCVFYNRQPNPPATIVVQKLWAVNGQPPVPHGTQDPSLNANASVNGVVTGFGDSTGGFTQGQTIPVNENVATLPTLCTLVSKQVTQFNGAPASFNLAGGDYQALLASGTNTVQITNTVTCPSQLTLRKDVDGDGVATNLWTLDALTPAGGIAFPAGSDSGAGVTAPVTPGLVYPLAESGGDPRYVQVDNRDPVLAVPGSTGSWACVPLDANGNPTGGNAGGLNGGVIVGFGTWVQCTAVNQTAQLTLVKQVQPLAGVTSDPADWNLTATPQLPPVPGLDAQTVTTGTTISVRPGKAYDLSESTVSGFEQVSLQCNTGDGYVDATSVTLPANGVGTCLFVNRPIPPKLWLVKVVSPSGAADPSAWTVTATGDGGAIVAQGPGGTGGYVEVPAGQDFALSESTVLPDADDFTASWGCSGGTLTGTTLSALNPGDTVICTVTNTLEPVVPTITKTAAIPTANADGTWTITYDIVVTNPSPFLDLTYQLGDDLEFGSSVTVNSASYQRTLPAPPGASTPFSAPITDPQQFADEPLLARGTSHTWQVTVNATVAPGADFSGSTEEACDDGTPGTVGFLNTASMVVDGQTYEAQDCELPVKPTVVKTGGTAVDNGDGTWTLPYTITVTNPSADTGIVYDLEDVIDLPASVTEVGVATATGPVPLVVTWTGHAPNTLLANDVALAGTAGIDQHVFTVSVTVQIDAADGGFICPSEDGLNNDAVVRSGNQVIEDDACVEITPPTISHDKVVVPGSVSQDADGSWRITYRIVVTNSSAVGGVYTLGDTLLLGAGVDSSAASYAVTLDGAPLGTPWAGSGPLVTNRYLPGTSGAPGSNVDTFEILVTGLTLDGPTLTPAQTACPPEGNTANGAFNNAAVLQSGGVTDVDTACDSPSAPTVVKSGATAAQQPDATWNVSYTITVDNSLPGAKSVYYSLTDTPAFASGVVYNTVSINGGAAVPYAGGAITLATGVPILGGDQAVHTLVFNVDVPAGAVDPDDIRCLAETPGKGFFNSVVVTSGEIVDEDTDCTAIVEGGKPTVDKSEGTATQDGDGLWTIEYDVTVTGNAEFLSRYTLTDTLRFGPEVDVQSAEWEQTAGGSDTGSWSDPAGQPTTTIVPTPRLIGIDGVHVYHVTVTALVSKDAFDDPTTNTCQPSEGAPNVGFLNEATLTSGNSTQSDTGCALPAAPEIVKTADGPAVRDGSGWMVSYTVTVHNTSPTQALVYDLTDTPDFSDSVTITEREVTSSDATVNPAWNTVPPTTDVVVEDQELLGDETDVFTVTVRFTVADVADDPSLRCEGEGGRGLLNGAIAVSGDSWTSEDCVDVPVIVILEKLWVIDGGEPIAWDSDDLPDGFTAQALLDGEPVDWSAENGPYAVGDEVGVDETDVLYPDGCELVDWSGVGDFVLAGTVNEFTVTNYVDCTQTVNLEKFVDNQYGGTAVPTDWTVSASGLDDGFGGSGTASGPVDVGVGYTLNEVSMLWADGVAYEVQSTWTCTSEQGDDAFTLVSAEGATSATLTVTQLGATVDCEIWNTDIQPTLTLVKHVEPEEVAGEFPPTLWFLAASSEGTAVVSGDGTATGAVTSNVPYELTEESDSPWAPLFTASPWTCTLDEGTGEVIFDVELAEVTLTPGQQVTCDITNTAPEFDVALEKTYELPEGETAVEGGDEFFWILTVTNLADPVIGLEVTDEIDPTVEVIGPAEFDPAAGWTQTSGDTDSSFAAEYAGVYPAGAVTTIRIPVRMLPEPPIVTPPAVDPNAPPPDVPPLNTDPIPNEACVAITGPVVEDPGLQLQLAAVAALPPILDDRNPDNNCDDTEVPVKRIAPAAYVRCIADVPWLYFDIQTTDNVAPAPITVTWTSADGSLVKVEQVEWDARNGRLLWPGAAVDANGIPYQFPGWRPITEEDLLNPGSVVPGTRFLDLILDETVPTFPWRGETYTPTGDPSNPYTVTTEPLTVTFSINPSQSVLAVYPQALPTCAIDRPPLLDIVKTSSVTTATPGSDFSYTLSVKSTGIGAASPVEIFDEIPSDLRVNTITTAGAPTFPRWEGCAVTGKNAQGYGGTLHCTLNGVLGPNILTAPDIVLGVTLNPSTKATSITNTGEVCYSDADATEVPPLVLCADSSVKVNVPQPLAGTGFPGDWRWYAAVLILLGGLVVGLNAIRRRRPAEAREE
ncbi:VWA domain-containing protein [Agromyces sp. MMS24-K17]|uniref:VWA domain-containing protein n=1 Tax=Agromyces sp. MMS24-K17 TaxID=3372850 RepID=UPI00375424A4